MVDTKKEKELVRQAQGEPLGQGRTRIEAEFPTVESPRKAEDLGEVESYITKIEKKFARIPKGQPGPQDDQVVVQQPKSNQPPVKLPVTKQQIAKGQKAKPELSIAWLVSWAVRQIKMMARLGRKVELAKIPEIKDEQGESR